MLATCFHPKTVTRRERRRTIMRPLGSPTPLILYILVRVLPVIMQLCLAQRCIFRSRYLLSSFKLSLSNGQFQQKLGWYLESLETVSFSFRSRLLIRPFRYIQQASWTFSNNLRSYIGDQRKEAVWLAKDTQPSRFSCPIQSTFQIDVHCFVSVFQQLPFTFSSTNHVVVSPIQHTIEESQSRSFEARYYYVSLQTQGHKIVHRHLHFLLRQSVPGSLLDVPLLESCIAPWDSIVPILALQSHTKSRSRSKSRSQSSGSGNWRTCVWVRER